MRLLNQGGLSHRSTTGLARTVSLDPKREAHMRVMIIGATGAVGTPLVRQLLEAGHEVIGTSRSQDRAEHLGILGAHPIVLDALDAPAVRTSVAAARPEAIIYQATGLAGVRILRSLDRPFAATNRLRTEGTRQRPRRGTTSRCAPDRGAKFRPLPLRTPGWLGEDRGRPARSRTARLGPSDLRRYEPPRPGGDRGGRDRAPLRRLLRPGRRGNHPRRAQRQTPLVGDGHGVMSFVHLDDAAAAAVLALDHDGPAIYNIVDDEPAPMSDWLPLLAQAVGARATTPLPDLDRPAHCRSRPDHLTEARGSSNAKARHELAWQPRYPTWREGFTAAYGEHPDAASRS